MAKASGGTAAKVGAIVRAGLRATLGLATGISQAASQRMMTNAMARWGALVPFLGEAMAGAKNKAAVANLMNLGTVLAGIAENHSRTRTRLQREAKERLELKAPAPTLEQEAKPATPDAAPGNTPENALQPNRAPQRVPGLYPTLDLKPPTNE